MRNYPNNSTIYSVEVDTPESALSYLEKEEKEWDLPENTRDWIIRVAHAHKHALKDIEDKLREKGADYEQWKITTLALYEHVKLKIAFDSELRSILQVTEYNDFDLTEVHRWLIDLVTKTMDAVRGKTVYYYNLGN